MQSKNKRIFLKIFLFLFICYIIVFVYVQFFRIYYNREPNNRWYYLNQVIDKKIDLTDSTIKYLFLGESRLNAGIDFMQISDCWSFAYGGTTPIEQYYILTKYLDKYPTPDTLFYSVSPRFLSEEFAFWDYAVRNDFFSLSEFSEITNVQNNLNDTILGAFPRLKFFLYKTNYIGYYQADIYLNKVFFGKTENIEFINWMQSHKGQQYHPNLLDSCSELNYETNYQHFNPSPLLDYYFNKIFSLCQEKSIPVVFIFMPMNESSVKNLSPDFITEYKNYIRDNQSKFPEFYISDTLYSYPDIFFGDNSHLNFSGQQKFTKQLKGRSTSVDSEIQIHLN